MAGVISGWTIAAIVISVLSMVVSLIQMLLYKPPEPPVPSPQEVSHIPTAEKGKSIPIVFGTRVVTTPNVVWWGCPHSVKNQVKASEMS